MVCRYQVIQSIEKSLQWIDSKKFLVNPLKHNYSNRESHKMFSELQFVMSSLCEIKDLLSNKSIRHIEEIVNFSKAIILDPRYYELVQKDTSCFRMYGVAVMSFLKCYNGIEVSFLKEIIQKSYDLSVNVSPEVLPFRKMEYYFSLLGLGIYDDQGLLASIRTVANNSILASNFDLFNYSIFEEYAITHSVFYLTNMGKEPLEIEQFPGLSNIILVLLCKNMLQKDLDLLGEFIIDMCCCNIRHNLLDVACRYIIKEQENNGVFLCPLRNNNVNLVDQTDIKHYFKANYHTTYVCLMT